MNTRNQTEDIPFSKFLAFCGRVRIGEIVVMTCTVHEGFYRVVYYEQEIPVDSNAERLF